MLWYAAQILLLPECSFQYLTETMEAVFRLRAEICLFLASVLMAGKKKNQLKKYFTIDIRIKMGQPEYLRC